MRAVAAARRAVAVWSGSPGLLGKAAGSVAGRSWVEANGLRCMGDAAAPASAMPSMPPNVQLDPSALLVLRTREDVPAVFSDPPTSLTSEEQEKLFGWRSHLVSLGPVGARPLVQSATELPVMDLLTGLPSGSVSLDPRVWNEPMRADIIKRVVDWQIACRRTTAYRGKTYAEVSGSGKKPFPQKGTGNARQGNKRAPQIRHGVVPHAPVLRDWSHNLQKRVRVMGLRVALSAKLADNAVTVVDNVAAFQTARTADINRLLLALNPPLPPSADSEEPAPATTADATAGQSTATTTTSKARAGVLPVPKPRGINISPTLLVVGPLELTTPLRRATANLQRTKLQGESAANVLDLLRHDHLVLSKAAVAAITERCADSR